MNLLADENIDQQIVERLRQDGHIVTYVAEFAPSSDDDEILQQANTQNAVFLTSDKDFGELVYRQHRVHGGVLLVRLMGLWTLTKADVVAQLLCDRGAEMVGAFTVVSPGMVRIRRSV